MIDKRDEFIKMLGGEVAKTTIEAFNVDAVSHSFIVDLNRLMAHHGITSQELEGIIRYHSSKPSVFRKD